MRYKSASIGFMVSLALVGCASATSGCAGWGGVTDEIDDFTKVRVVQSGKGFVYCTANEALLCSPGFYLSFKWAGGEDVIATVTYSDYVSIEQLEWNVDGEILQSISVGTSTELDGQVLSTGRSVTVVRESTQRFAIPRAMARRLLEAKSTLVRVRLANSVVSKAGDFLRPTVSGQPSASEILREVLKRADGGA